MSLDQPIVTAADHWPALLTAGVLVALLAGLAALIVRRTSGAVLTAGIGAFICTAYSGDTSWRFAEHRLGMANADERAVMFAAGEAALLACAVMARANKRATATDDSAGTPGVPGVLVWCITGVQVIPAFAESGFWAGIVRAVFGPVMAALLWHLAMGLEIRVTRPEALSTGLPAQIGHELRERLLSHLGLATRNRTAEEITRDRAHARAVRLGARRHLGPWGRARLAAAVARTRAAADSTRRHALLTDLAGRRTAEQLRTMDVTSPWVLEPAPYPTAPQPETATPRHLAVAAAPSAAAPAVPPEAPVLDLAPMLPPQPDVRSPDPAAAQPQSPHVTPATAAPATGAAAPDRSRSEVAQLRSPDADAHVLEQAQVLNARVLAETKARVSQRQLQRDLGIGQRRAQRIHAQLPTTLTAAPATATAAQPPATEASAR